jgi:hypothetical protein
MGIDLSLQNGFRALSASDLFLFSVNKLSVLGLRFFRQPQKGLLLLLPESAAKSCKRNVRLQPHVVITEYKMTYTPIELHNVSIFCQTQFPQNIDFNCVLLNNFSLILKILIYIFRQMTGMLKSNKNM